MCFCQSKVNCAIRETKSNFAAMIALKMQQNGCDIAAKRLKLRLFCSNIVSPQRGIFNNFPAKNIDKFFSEAH